MRKHNSFKPDALTLLKAKQERLLAQKAKTDQALQILDAEMEKANEMHGNNQFHVKAAKRESKRKEEEYEPVRD